MHLGIRLGICLIVVGQACQFVGQEPANAPLEDATPLIRSMEDAQIERNKNFLQKERASIEAYISDRNWKMERSGNGLYYNFLTKPLGLEKPKMREEVLVSFSAYLLDGTGVTNGTNKRIRVGADADYEMGFHEALQMMEPGMDAVFILPSHLAHGLAGDLDKVPPMSALVYEIQLIKIFKQ
jgi:FKBP-type peptidyl-prolyl cis-trans isomerase